MCGISGILTIGSGARAELDTLQRMTKAMAHRGPDGDGHWVSDDGRIGLGHRRLAIIDLSADAAQPMQDAQGRIVLTYNGEIYNHLDLRKQLESKGHAFRTDHSDTEVLIHGYKEWGLEGLVSRLYGMFAFAIWDQDREVLSVARDRVGIKPLYFTRNGGRFLFASEIKGILADQSVPRTVNEAALPHYLSFMVTPAPLTLFRGIFKLPAGHVMEVKADGAARAWRYWDALPGQSGRAAEAMALPKHEREERIARDVLDILERAVDRRMMADVPFGVFLSGGIDSSANTALMSRISTQPVKTFTVGFKDHTHLNELDYARQVAKEFKTDHHEVLIEEDDMRGYLAQLIHAQDEPIADWVCVPLYFVSKLARDSGVKVVQVGEGSDEQFAGYGSYMSYLKLAKALRFVPGGGTASALAPLAGMLSALSPGRKGLGDRAKEALRRHGRGQPMFWSGANAFWSIHQERYLNSAPTSHPDDLNTGVDGLSATAFDRNEGGEVIAGYMADLMRGAGGSTDALTEMIYSEFRLRLPELLLMRVDKITMSTSIEGRVPFLDHDLVDYTMSIGQAAKVGDGLAAKQLLKRAVRGVIPDSIIDRPKMGFAAPVADWLKGDFGREAEASLLASELIQNGSFDSAYIRDRFTAHREGREDNALHLWVLHNLTGWFDHWIDGQAA